MRPNLKESASMRPHHLDSTRETYLDADIVLDMSSKSHIRDPDEYLKELVSRIFSYLVIEDKTWQEASTLAAQETRKMMESDIKKDIIDGLIDMLFE